MKFKVSTVFWGFVSVIVGILMMTFLPPYVQQRWPNQQTLQSFVFLSAYTSYSVLNVIVFTFNDTNNSFWLKFFTSPIFKIPRLIREFVWGDRFFAKIDGTWSLVWGKVMPNENLNYKHGEDVGVLALYGGNDEPNYYRVLAVFEDRKFSKEKALNKVAEWNISELRKKYPSLMERGIRRFRAGEYVPYGGTVYYPVPDGIAPGVAGEIQIQARGFWWRVEEFRNRWF